MAFGLAYLFAHLDRRCPLLPPLQGRMAALLSSYQLPLQILLLSVCLQIGFSSFMLNAMRESSAEARERQSGHPPALGLRSDTCAASRAVDPLQTWWLSMLVLLPGNLFFVLFDVAFLRAVVSSPGVVAAEPWQWRPRADMLQQRRLRAKQAEQRQWIKEAGAVQQAGAAAEEQQRQQRMQLCVVASRQPDLAAKGGPRLGVKSGDLAVLPTLSNAEEMTATSVVIPRPAAHLPSLPLPNMVEELHVVLPAACRSDGGKEAQADSIISHVATAAEDGVFLKTASAADPPLLAGGALPSPLQHSTPNRNFVAEFEADGSLRYCRVCCLYKPDGSHHCRHCQRCIVDMDHHCPYLNNCVGRQNFKYFFLSLTYAVVICFFNAPAFIFFYISTSAACKKTKWWLVIPLTLLVTGLPVSYLFLQHVCLLLDGVSTLDRMAERSAALFLQQINGQHPCPCRYIFCIPRFLRCRVDRRCCCCCLLASSGPTAESLPKTDAPFGPTRGQLVVFKRCGVECSMAQETILKRHRRFRLLFGSPTRWWRYLVPLAPLRRSVVDEEAAAVVM